jgi:hypothetical protein
VQAFRNAVEDGDVEAAIACLAPDVRFRSPAVHRPYEGSAAVGELLRHVFAVFEDFTYTDQLTDGARSVLFFKARVGDRELEGLDDITVDDAGKIVDLRVMIRPLSGLNALAEAMGARLATGSAATT